MLQRLVIQNFRRFRSIDLDLGPGMTALSGETGAGKSMLTTAIALALGNRAGGDMLAPGARRGEVQCWFRLGPGSPADLWLRERDYGSLDAPEECVLRRVLTDDGRSRAFVNGTQVQVGEMGQLGALLMDHVAQNQKHSLQQGQTRLGLLDGFWDSEAALRRTAATWDAWQRARLLLDEARGGDREGPQRLDWLRWQVGELDAALPQDGPEQAEREHRLLANAAKTRGLLAGAAANLNEAVLPGLASLRRALEGLGDIPGAESLLKSLEQGEAPLSDLASELDAAGSRAEEDPQRLTQLDELLGKLDGLARKHGCAVSELPQARGRLQEQAEALEAAAADLPELERAEAQALSRYEKASAALRKARSAHSAGFGSQVQKLLRELGMKQARLECLLEEAPPGPAGADACQLTLATAAGEKPQPAHQIASGGELSRLHLALRLCCHGRAQPPLLVLDEIDAGLGGVAGRVLGKRVRALGSAGTQVLCVTHLAVVAACADRQVLVLDGEDGVQAQPLQRRDRLRELARMLTGSNDDSASHEAARELLESLGA